MDAFIHLTTTLTNPALTVDRKLKMICQVTSEVIDGADRVSLWTFKDNYSKMVSTVSFNRIKKQYGSVSELTREDYPEYFEAIIQNSLVKADDARGHPQTSCFNDSYFKPFDIHSLMDYILHHDFKPIGVICCESVARAYQWTEQDVNSLKRIARASSLYFKLDHE